MLNGEMCSILSVKLLNHWSSPRGAAKPSVPNARGHYRPDSSPFATKQRVDPCRVALAQAPAEEHQTTLSRGLVGGQSPLQPVRIPPNSLLSCHRKSLSSRSTPTTDPISRRVRSQPKNSNRRDKSVQDSKRFGAYQKEPGEPQKVVARASRYLLPRFATSSCSNLLLVS